MQSLVSRLFNHYCDHHFTVTSAGFPIFDGDGEKLGHVDRLSFGRNTVRIEGWCVADKVALGRVAKADWQRPNIKRSDVNASLDLPETTKTGFNLVWFGDTSGLVLSLKFKTTTLQLMCPDVARWDMLKAQVHIRISFVKSVVRASWPLMRAYFKPTPINKSTAKRALGMRDTQVCHVLDARFFASDKRVMKAEKLTLVMPVFNAYDVLCEALARIATNTDVPWRLILVEDCSTDERVRLMLESWVKQQQSNGADIILLANAKNVGFIGSVNRALETARRFKDHVVLINSDALVPPKWATRLIAPIQQNNRIASVTPLSNDAEIFTAPVMCKRYDLRAGEADKIDAALLHSISNRAHQIGPTGVGFCMALNQKFLRKVPQLDTVFGKGYGEEVDWCQRVKNFGGTHAVQPNLFVEHCGGSSFGSSAKRNLIARNNQIVTKRYPNFDQSVQVFMATDPVRTARVFAAAVLLSARQKSVDIYIAHSLGGGAEMYLKEKIKSNLSRGKGSIVLRVGGVMRWRIEAHLDTGMIFGDTDDDGVMQQILETVQNANVIYSCAVGDADPLSLPQKILRLAKHQDAKITFLMHDYFAISPSYCLLDFDGVFRPDALAQNADKAHTFTDKTGRTSTLKQWRSRWAKLLDGSDEVVCFSQSSVDILRASFPNLRTKVTVDPHRTPKIRLAKPSASSGTSALGILGDIGFQKGAKCLQELSQTMPNQTLHHLAVVGRLDPRYSLGEMDVETGSYQRSEIASYAEQLKIAAWLIPSIWPETFSYTTHEALATGLPVFCFEIGAQAEAVKRAENGYILPLDLVDHPQLILSHISEVLEHDALRRRFHSRAKKPWRRGVTARLKSTG